jgi:hypothetical protein
MQQSIKWTRENTVQIRIAFIKSVKILDTFIQFKANVVFFLDNNLQKKGAVGKFANGNLPLLLPKRTVINH